MTLVFRAEPHVMHSERAGNAPRRDQSESHPLGSGMQIVCSPWEGIYLEQAYSFMPGGPEDRTAKA